MRSRPRPRGKRRSRPSHHGMWASCTSRCIPREELPPKVTRTLPPTGMTSPVAFSRGAGPGGFPGGGRHPRRGRGHRRCCRRCRRRSDGPRRAACVEGVTAGAPSRPPRRAPVVRWSLPWPPPPSLSSPSPPPGAVTRRWRGLVQPAHSRRFLGGASGRRSLGADPTHGGGVAAGALRACGGRRRARRRCGSRSVGRWRTRRCGGLAPAGAAVPS